ncbi:MAG: aldehyde dehydrogenase family protein [Rhodococcus sp. (in: high G+C Gram-positive bacteria)]|uniref:aldehyde dehydrogenase family protein n=1 Tax=Rhodococcus sp. TaxID=1831 RepID=UPI003BB02410
MIKKYPHLFIDGAWVPTESGEVQSVINPATEAVIGTAPIGSRADVVRAIEAARKAFDEGPWPQMSMRERSAVMLRMAEGMEKRFEELVQLNIAEAGGTRMGAEGFQIGIPIQHFRDMAERVMFTYPMERPVAPYVGAGIGQGVVRREPFGVAALISAYNFPFFLNVMKLAPALASGCTTVLKPAPTTPLEAFVLAEIAEEAGLPPGVLNIIHGDVDTAVELTTNPLVDLVSFTGSDVVGRKVLEQASPTMKKVVLELGGKSANIICEDADLGKAIQSVIAGIIVHAGQGCALLTRTLVHRSRMDELVAMIKEILSGIKVGDPSEPDTVMGPLGSEAQRAKVEDLIRTGVEEGATIAYGGGRPAGLDKGFFVEPTLFVDVDNSMAIAQREFFGPVGVVIPFDDDDEAVRIANDSDYGLGGGVWANDPVRAYAIAKRIRAGYVTVNGGGGGLSPHTAFGGYKQSGLGREWGEAGLEEFLQIKTIAWGVASG